MTTGAPPEPLRPRQEAILRVVVEEHIATGAPVGSKHIAGREGVGFSPSTVRYELARLEDLGYLDHPHTSAGRVPTDRGYRYYVDALLERDPPAEPPAVLRGALSRNEVYLRIGSELPDRSLAGLAMVAANYGVPRRNLGTVSVLGPVRMDYRLAMATVRGAAQLLSEYVEGMYE